MKKVLFVLAVLFGTGIAADVAQAYTQPALYYHINDPNDPISCWQWFLAGANPTQNGLTRTCPGTFAVDFPLSFDTDGNWSVVVVAKKPTSSSQVSCQMFTVTSTGGWLPGSVVNLTNSGLNAYHTMTLPTMNVPPGGTGFVECLVRQGAYILEIGAVSVP